MNSLHFSVIINIAYAAFSGDYLELSFALPFTDFLPPTMELKFRIQVNIKKQLVSSITFRQNLILSFGFGDFLKIYRVSH